ncbi:helix-turn-helix domain-containing protein [Chryseobacterium sp. Leaf201]|uniref:helix-turn-helix domain-containing protein n=1 Tax=Chryseobacterium sp. Leaf201 TaxID=1735672 RepID=UPI001EE6CD7E|nr:helix-turn-helix transcriptional regulator [Chryseobacterium sp. Leaf201]
MERFHEFLDGKLVVLVRDTSFCYALTGYYQFADTNIITIFNCGNKTTIFFFSMDDKFVTIYKTVGKNLRDKRKEKNLSQQQLADLAGKMDRSKISDIENGKEDFLFSTLLKICGALDMDIDDLFTK